jgi:hypothetical protein
VLPLNTTLPPPHRLPTRKLRPTSLQLLQNIHRIISIQIQLLVHAPRTPPPNLLDNVTRVRSPNNRHLRRKPLLERLRDEVPILCEPPGHGRADVDCLDGVGDVGGGREGYVALVDWDVLFCGGCYADLFCLSVSKGFNIW